MTFVRIGLPKQEKIGKLWNGLLQTSWQIKTELGRLPIHFQLSEWSEWQIALNFWLSKETKTEKKKTKTKRKRTDFKSESNHENWLNARICYFVDRKWYKRIISFFIRFDNKMKRRFYFSFSFFVDVALAEANWSEQNSSYGRFDADDDVDDFIALSIVTEWLDTRVLNPVYF